MEIDTTAYGVALIPLISAIVEVVKRLLRWFMIEDFISDLAPVLSMGLGIAAAFAFLDLATHEALLVGVVTGLSASGVYSVISHGAERVQQMREGQRS